MKRRIPALLCSFPLLVVAASLAGCEQPAATPSKPPLVSVSLPVRREVTDFRQFTGRTQAPETVEVRARVTGYLEKMPFKEGEEVKKGDLLFEIDPRPYKAELDRLASRVGLAEAAYRLAKADYARAERASRGTAGAVSRQELETYRAKEIEARESVGAAKANAEGAKLNLEFCTIKSPLSGKVSRYNYTVGNLVNADQTVLTNIVSQDPMYAYFDVDERTLLLVQDLIRQGKVKARRETDYPVAIELANEKGFPHQGTINFVDNQVNAGTGTLRVRGVFKNPAIKDSRALSPGLFVRVRIPLGEPHEALLVADQAVGTDQGQKVLYVVNDKDEVVSRPVTLGGVHDGLREVLAGLSANERVIVNGLQRVRPGLTVEPRVVPMPGVPGSRSKKKPTANQGK
jgi:RND family efflux transporter MFP subunit